MSVKCPSDVFLDQNQKESVEVKKKRIITSFRDIFCFCRPTPPAPSQHRFKAPAACHSRLWPLTSWHTVPGPAISDAVFEAGVIVVLAAGGSVRV